MENADSLFTILENESYKHERNWDRAKGRADLGSKASKNGTG